MANDQSYAWILPKTIYDNFLNVLVIMPLPSRLAMVCRAWREALTLAYLVPIPLARALDWEIAEAPGTEPVT